MRNIAIIVEDEPSQELLREMDIQPPDTLLGLYPGRSAHRALVGAASSGCPTAS